MKKLSYNISYRKHFGRLKHSSNNIFNITLKIISAYSFCEKETCMKDDFWFSHLQLHNFSIEGLGEK